MLFKKKKKVITTREALNTVTTKLAEDIGNLSTRKENAVSAFRNTAIELDVINTGLRASMNDLEGLSAFIAEQRDAAAKEINDNTKVRDKILELIGEE